jgi:hypothetical protein
VTFVREAKLETRDGTPAKTFASWVVKLLLLNVSLRLFGACAYAAPRRAESARNFGSILKANRNGKRENWSELTLDDYRKKGHLFAGGEGKLEVGFGIGGETAEYMRLLQSRSSLAKKRIWRHGSAKVTRSSILALIAMVTHRRSQWYPIGIRAVAMVLVRRMTILEDPKTWSKELICPRNR